MIVYRCPKCSSSERLWQGIHVSAWQPLDERGGSDKSRREVDWAWVDELDEGGCGDCGWDGSIERMKVTLGIDGKPLPELHVGQLEIANG